MKDELTDYIASKTKKAIEDTTKDITDGAKKVIDDVIDFFS